MPMLTGIMLTHNRALLAVAGMLSIDGENCFLHCGGLRPSEVEGKMDGVNADEVSSAEETSAVSVAVVVYMEDEAMASMKETKDSFHNPWKIASRLASLRHS